MRLLIGICFLDAARFRENCFCVGFIAGDYSRLCAVGKHRFGGRCKLASVLRFDRCPQEAAGSVEVGEVAAALRLHPHLSRRRRRIRGFDE